VSPIVSELPTPNRWRRMIMTDFLKDKEEYISQEEREQRFIALREMVGDCFGGASIIRGPRIFSCPDCDAPFLVTNQPRVQELDDSTRNVFTSSARAAGIAFWFVSGPAGEGEFRVMRIVPPEETITCHSADEVGALMDNLLLTHICPTSDEQEAMQEHVEF
jgi:hypothetical protein